VKLPLYRSILPYEGSWLRPDLIAGLTVWAVLVPEALAYASIAGVSPVVGLYAAPAALVFYAALGSSRHLVVGPMSATAALSAATVAKFAGGGSDRFVQLTVALALITGLIALVAGLLRLGFLANYISEPVIKGFIVGLALTIIAGQLPKLFGVPSGSGNFFEKIWDLLTKLDDTSGLTLLVGIASLALVFGLRRFAPVVPASLVAVAFGVALVKLFDLDQHGVAIVGHIDSGLPPLGLPDHVHPKDYLDLAGPAVGVMLVGFAEGLGAAKTYAARAHYEIDVNRELLGLGAANLGAGLSAGMVVNGSLSKTAVNGSAGARSQLSGLTVAALTIVTLLFLTSLFEDLPEATLAAVVIAAVIELVDIRSLVRLYRIFTGPGRRFGLAPRPDFVAAVAALLGVTVFDTLPGLFIGIAVSFLLLLYRASAPHIAVLGAVPGAPGHYADVRRDSANTELPGLLLLRPEAGLFFANADHVRTQILAQVERERPVAVILDAETVPYIDVTAVTMLDELAGTLELRGVKLVVAHDIGMVRDVVRRASDGETAIPVYRTVDDAVHAVEPTGARS
jgi:high affinity sulfate transporter 1